MEWRYLLGYLIHFFQKQPLEVFYKKGFLTNFSNSQENTCTRASLTETCNFIKKGTLAQVFSFEIREICKKTFFYRTPLGDCFYSFEFLQKVNFQQ